MNKRILWCLLALSVLFNALGWYSSQFSDVLPDEETLKAIFLALAIVMCFLSSGSGVYAFTMLLIQYNQDRTTKKTPNTWVELYTRLGAAQKLGINVDRMRNYELEEKLSTPSRPVVISELCPFNGVHCAWISFCPEEILDDLIKTCDPSVIPYLEKAKQRRFGKDETDGSLAE